MSKEKPSQNFTLRQKAEGLWENSTFKKNSPLSEAETFKLIHELEVHQIELELQKEELEAAKVRAEDADTKIY